MPCMCKHKRERSPSYCLNRCGLDANRRRRHGPALGHATTHAQAALQLPDAGHGLALGCPRKIMQEAAAVVLAQANMGMQGVLELLA